MIKAILCLVVPAMLQAPSAPKAPPAQPPPAAPKTAPAQPAPRTTSSRGAAGRPATLELRVTDRSGKTLPNAHVSAEGGVGRDDVTDPSGLVTFRNLPAGVYRLHVEDEGYVTLEKEITVAAGSTTTGQAALSAAPPPPPPPPPPPAPTPPPPASPALEAGPPRLLSIPDFVDAQRMGREGVKTSPIGCSGATQARMIQVRDPLAAHTHADADEVLYDVAGDATIHMGGKDQVITSGWIVMVPRGTEHSVTRAGRNPVILVSVISGPPCSQAGAD